MIRLVTLDASVFTNASNSNEEGSAASGELMKLLRHHAIPFVEPTLVLAEVASALRRGQNDTGLATAYVEALVRLPRLTLVSLDQSLALEACRFAISHGLRGADAVYVAAASRYAATLVTRDTEQRERAPKAVSPCTPEEALRMLKQSPIR